MPFTRPCGFRMTPLALRSLFLFSFLLALAGCGDDDDDETDRRALTDLGVQITSRGPSGADPILAEAYLVAAQGGLDLAQFCVDWGEVEGYAGRDDWSWVQLHAAQSRIRGLPESVVVLLVDNQTRGLLPPDLAGAAWDDPRVLHRFTNFVRILRDQFEGRLQYLWLGREVDAYFATNRSEIPSFRVLLEAVRDSLRSQDAAPLVGTILSYDQALEGGRLDLGDSLAPSVERLGLTAYGRDASYSEILAPQAAIEQIRQAAGRFAMSTVVITETSYPGGSGADPSRQEEFAEGLVRLLEVAPPNLEGVVWFCLHDWDVEAAEARALHLFAGEAERVGNYTLHLRQSGLRDISGVGKPAWRVVQDWQHASNPVGVAGTVTILQ